MVDLDSAALFKKIFFLIYSVVPWEVSIVNTWEIGGRYIRDGMHIKWRLCFKSVAESIMNGKAMKEPSQEIPAWAQHLSLWLAHRYCKGELATVHLRHTKTESCVQMFIFLCVWPCGSPRRPEISREEWFAYWYPTFAAISFFCLYCIQLNFFLFLISYFGLTHHHRCSRGRGV